MNIGDEVRHVKCGRCKLLLVAGQYARVRKASDNSDWPVRQVDLTPWVDRTGDGLRAWQKKGREREDAEWSGAIAKALEEQCDAGQAVAILRNRGWHAALRKRVALRHGYRIEYDAADWWRPRLVAVVNSALAGVKVP